MWKESGGVGVIDIEEVIRKSMWEGASREECELVYNDLVAALCSLDINEIAELIGTEPENINIFGSITNKDKWIEKCVRGERGKYPDVDILVYDESVLNYVAPSPYEESDAGHLRELPELACNKQCYLIDWWFTDGEELYQLRINRDWKEYAEDEARAHCSIFYAEGSPEFSECVEEYVEEKSWMARPLVHVGLWDEGYPDYGFAREVINTAKSEGIPVVEFCSKGVK